MTTFFYRLPLYIPEFIRLENLKQYCNEVLDASARVSNFHADMLVAHPESDPEPGYTSNLLMHAGKAAWCAVKDHVNKSL